MSHEAEIEALVTAVKQSRKYGDTSEETIRQLATEALQRHKKPKAALKSVRTQLHSIMAPYLGDPDYEAAKKQLTAVFATHDPVQIKATCRALLATHLSTRERLPPARHLLPGNLRRHRQTAQPARYRLWPQSAGLSLDGPAHKRPVLRLRHPRTAH
ncbi:MAG: hypothetical protein M5U34_23745 [Chloroflexi bacterium]|nr:hypothetical protein [Chloroflexota bacterium]